MCPHEQDPLTWQAGSSLGLSKLSSLSAAGRSRWLHLGGLLPTKGQASLCLAGWQRQGQLATSPTLPSQNTRHLLHRHCICLRESLLKCLAQPNQLQGVSNFSPHFRTWPPAPFRWGGGVTFSFPKNTILGPLCVFFEKRQLKYKHFSQFFSIF